MAEPKKQFHHSHMDSLHRCGVAFEFGYIEGIKVRPGVASLVGSATHESAAKNLHAKLDTGHLLPIEQVAEDARDSLLDRWAEGVHLDADELAEHGAKVMQGQATDKAVRLSEYHHVNLAPVLEPIEGGVEKAFVVEADGFPFDLAGEIDVIEAGKIRDLKTSKSSPGKDAAATSDQLTMYALAMEAMDGELPKEVWLDHIIDLKSGPKLQHSGSVRGPEHIEMFWRRLERDAEVIDRGAFTPARRTDWWCSVKFCGYARDNPQTGKPWCSFFANTVTIQTGGLPGSSPKQAGGKKRARAKTTSIKPGSPEWAALVVGGK